MRRWVNMENKKITCMEKKNCVLVYVHRIRKYCFSAKSNKGEGLQHPCVFWKTFNGRCDFVMPFCANFFIWIVRMKHKKATQKVLFSYFSSHTCTDKVWDIMPDFGWCHRGVCQVPLTSFLTHQHNFGSVQCVCLSVCLLVGLPVCPPACELLELLPSVKQTSEALPGKYTHVTTSCMYTGFCRRANSSESVWQRKVSILGGFKRHYIGHSNQ